MGVSSLIAVDVGATHVTGAQFRRAKGGKLILQQLEREPLVSESTGDEGWLAAVESALAALARRRRWRGEVHLGLPGHLAFTRCVMTPRVARSKSGAVMAFEASRAIPYPLEQVEWGYLVKAERGAERETLLMAVKSEPMRALCDAVAASGFEIARALPASLALAHTFQLSEPGIRSGVLVSVGARSTHVLLLEGARVLPRTLPLGGNTLTQTIAGALQVEFGRAEAIKLQHLAKGFDPGTDHARHAIVIREARRFADRLRMEISRSITNGREQAFAEVPEAVYLTGGGAAFEELPGWLHEQLVLPVHRLDPLRSDSVIVPDGGRDVAGQDLIDVLGVAAASGDEFTEGNLLPAMWRAAARFRRRQPVILALAALIVTSMIPPLWSHDRAAREARTENAVLSGEIRSLQMKVEQHATAVARLKATRRQLEALRRLAESNANWTGFFAELQQSLLEVEDVWLDCLEVVPAESEAEIVNGLADGRPAPVLRLRLRGRMLDRNPRPTSAARGAESRVQQLLARVGRSRFVHTIDGEHFDTRQRGILRFEFSVSVNPGSLF